MSSRTWVLGGRVVDPVLGLDEPREVAIFRGRIEALWKPGSASGRPAAGERILDAGGCWVLPGLIDMHVHLREPGGEAAEDVASGTRAAAAGGFTTVVCQPNTRPVLDSLPAMTRLQKSLRDRSGIRVIPAVALSRGLKGRALAPLRELVLAGAGAVSDDGVGTADGKLLGRAVQQAAMLSVPVLLHCEDRRRSADGVASAGKTARSLGLPPIPVEAEVVGVQRAISAARRARGHLHIQHVSTARALQLVARAKQEGLAVSCEVTPHHLFLTENALEEGLGPHGPSPNLKMNPPLRTSRDVESLRRGLSLGLVDAIASDHAPHTRSSKQAGFLKAPFGVIGLETMLSLALQLVREGIISRMMLVRLLSAQPAAIMGIDGGTLRPGSRADVTVVQPDASWRVVPSRLRSKSRNTPFAGWQLPGLVRYTVSGGKLVHKSTQKTAR